MSEQATSRESEYLADLMARSFAMYLREKHPGTRWRRVREPLLTTREVAEYLGVSPETVLRRARSGELPAIRVASNALRFELIEIEKWLEAMKEETS